MYDHLNKTKILTSVIAIAIPIFSFLGFNNVFAIDDYSIDLDASHTSLIGICNNSNPSSSTSGHACTDYKYLYFSTEDDYSSVNSSTYFVFADHNRFQANSLNNTVVFSIPSNTNISIFSYNAGNMPSGWKITATFSNVFPGATPPSGSLNITENGIYNVSEVSSVNVNVPQEEITEIIDDPVSNDFHKIFMVVVAGVIPAFAVFVIVWFAIDLMSSLFFGRGK